MQCRQLNHNGQEREKESIAVNSETADHPEFESLAGCCSRKERDLSSRRPANKCKLSLM